MSKEPCVPADTPMAETSLLPHSKERPKGRSKKCSKPVPIRWDKVKVFEQPVLRVPFKLAHYVNGPHKRRGYVAPPDWLMAAVESGLAVMEPPKGDSQAHGYIEGMNGQPPKGMSRSELQKLLAEGIAKTLEELNQLAAKKEETE